jgi:hypothetical protein
MALAWTRLRIPPVFRSGDFKGVEVVCFLADLEVVILKDLLKAKDGSG